MEKTETAMLMEGLIFNTLSENLAAYEVKKGFAAKSSFQKAHSLAAQRGKGRTIKGRKRF